MVQIEEEIEKVESRPETRAWGEGIHDWVRVEAWKEVKKIGIKQGSKKGVEEYAAIWMLWKKK